jgi:hypothetical protein
MNPSNDELAELRARLAVLENERFAARRRWRWLAGAAGLAVLVGTAASAANGSCPNGLPVCFTPDTPALAAEVNLNFMQLKEWVEKKVGAVGGTPVTISTITPPVQATRGLFVSSSTTGNLEPIADFRHDNLMQGVGIGWSSIVATGTAANQDLFFQAKGSGQLYANSKLNVGATKTTCTTAPCYCPVGTYPLSWAGSCSGFGIGVYSVSFASNAGGQFGFDVQCVTSTLNQLVAVTNLSVMCSKLVTQ